MANILNNIIANQPIKPAKQAQLPAFTFDAEGKIKPLQDKARLLPSRIFGSPIEYVKDLKQDVVNIGHAMKGKSNDHSLGRINDVAMKLGSLGLAAYLFAKNPLKLSKTMEFVGFGTFFASMALWPKLAIQAPIKARTGVDIHQKYIDSQGRKKMLHQDPQYDLTDLYSREDLDKMGKKLGVSENLPDRDSFIKQRAKKTAVQGNTLWMMTAGIATPVMSALACNALEKPINNAIEAIDLNSSQKALDRGTLGFFDRIKQKFASKSFDKFLTKNADKSLDENMVRNISSYMGKSTNAASIQSVVATEISGMKKAFVLDESFIRKALAGQIDDALIASLPEAQKKLLNQAMNEGSLRSVANILSQATTSGKRAQSEMSKKLFRTLETAKKSAERPTVGDVAGKIKELYGSLTGLSADKKLLDRFVDARVGDKSGTYIANQWSRVCNELIKSLKLNGKELKALASGDMSVLTDKLAKLSADDVAYDKVVSKLMKLIGDYEAKTGESFISTVQSKTSSMSRSASKTLSEKGFNVVARNVADGASRGTLRNVIDGHVRERVSGAQSSFYRLLQSLDLSKRVNNGDVAKQIKTILTESGQAADDKVVQRLVKACKDLLFSATTTDHVEKLKSAGFNLSEKEYKLVMDVVFGDAAGSTLKKSLGGGDKAKTLLSGFDAYRKEFMTKVANWQNGMTPELSRRVVDGATNSANAIQRNNIVGKPFKSLVQDVAKQTYNSKKWLKIFGGTMAALTAVTLIAGLAIGRKTKVEKQLEEESKKVNG